MQKNETKVIHGQKLFFPSKDQWNEAKTYLTNKLSKVKNIDKVEKFNLDVLEMYINYLDYISRFPEIRIAIAQENIIKNRHDEYYIILNKDNLYYRICLENKTCEICKWEGMTGYPYEIASYFGIPDNLNKFSFMKEAEKIELNCPNCNAIFLRPAIWLGPAWSEVFPPRSAESSEK